MLTIPTAEHGEQMLNATQHAANFPYLVRARPALAADDVLWVAGFEPTDASRAESAALRERVASLARDGSPLLGTPMR